MSETRDIFYNLFWQSKTCRNLFLLSKEELLDTKSISLDEDLAVSVSYPRIIISNVEKNDDVYQTLKIRTETDKIKKEKNLQSKISKYQPLLSNFVETKFGKSVEKLIMEVNDKPSKFVKLLGKLMLAGEQRRESLIIEQLQQYGFIGKHINSFNDLGVKSEEGARKIVKDVFTEENFKNLLDFLKSAKDLYINSTFEDYYSSNQILVNSLFSQDDFQSRIGLFSRLYDIGILSLSNEDSFVECVHCQSGTYRGSLQIRITPSRLKNLVCPVCERLLNYYIPYQLHDDIFNIVKSKDGLLLDVLAHKLSSLKIQFRLNEMILNDVEIDCRYSIKNSEFIVESKMFKQNTTHDKLTSKIKESLSKLLTDVDRISKLDSFREKELVPVLLVNIPDKAFLSPIKNDFNRVNDVLLSKAHVVTIDDFESVK
jgi:hypothetical protein